MSLPIQPAPDIFTIFKKANLSTSIVGKIVECDTANVTVTSSVLPDGASTSALQITGNDYLNNVVLQTTGINNKLTTANTTLDDISLNILSLYNLEKRTFNLPRSSIVLHNSVAVLADSISTQFIMGENDDDLTSKDIYNTIQLNGRVPYDSSYSCVLEFSNDGTYWFSDHIEPNIKRLGTSAYSTFSLTRTNVCSQYARVYHLQGATELFLQASLMRY